jgi:hypothetical protein
LILRQKLAVLAASMAVTLGMVVIPASPAVAASAPTFTYTYESGETQIHVWLGGYERATGLAINLHESPNRYYFYIEDEYCDSVGPTFHTWLTGSHQLTFSPNGCHTSSDDYTYASSLGSPKNWWVEWGGYNSNAQSMP